MLVVQAHHAEVSHEVTSLPSWLIEGSCVVWSLRTARVRYQIIGSSVNWSTTLIVLWYCPIGKMFLSLGSILINSCLIRLKFILHIDLVHHLLLFIEIPSRHQILPCWILWIYLSLVKYHLASPRVLSNSRVIYGFIITRVCTWILSCVSYYPNWGRAYKILLIWIHLIVIDASDLIRSKHEITTSCSSVGTLSYRLLLRIVFNTKSYALALLLTVPFGWISTLISLMCIWNKNLLAPSHVYLRFIIFLHIG